MNPFAIDPSDMCVHDILMRMMQTISDNRQAALDLEKQAIAESDFDEMLQESINSCEGVEKNTNPNIQYTSKIHQNQLGQRTLTQSKIMSIN